MTQTQRVRQAYSIAAVSVIASYTFWTLVLVLVAAPVKTPEDGIAWQGIIRQGESAQSALQYSKKFVQEKTIAVADLLHDAAEDIGESVGAVVLEQTTDSSRTKGGTNTISELDQWEIQRAYTLQLPTLGISSPVLLPSMAYWSSHEWDLLEEQMQVGLSYGTVAYPHSSVPGENGTIFIAGHSSPPDERAKESEYGYIFQRLPDVQEGDEILLIKDGTTSRYRVQSAIVVSPSQTTILEQQSRERLLKLITCYPIGTTRDRLVVTAERVDE